MADGAIASSAVTTDLMYDGSKITATGPGPPYSSKRSTSPPEDAASNRTSPRWVTKCADEASARSRERWAPGPVTAPVGAAAGPPTPESLPGGARCQCRVRAAQPSSGVVSLLVMPF